MSQILIIASYYQFWPENLLESRKNVRSLNPGEWSACFEPGNPLKSKKPFLTHWISLQINPPNHMRFYKNFYFILPMYALFNLVALIVLLNCFYCPIVFRELFNCEASHHSWSFHYHFTTISLTLKSPSYVFFHFSWHRKNAATKSVFQLHPLSLVWLFPYKSFT